MSESSHDEHSTFIKTPKQLVIVVVLAFVVPIVLILLLTQIATRQGGVDRGDPAMSEEAIAKRLKPVGEVAIVDVTAPKTERTGEQVFQAVCAACHTTGALNAPKIGDAARWKPLIGEGFETLVQNAIKGIRAMPPRGGNPDLSDVEVARAVAFMANKSGGNFQEPAAKAVAKVETPSAPQAGAAAPAASAAPAAAPAAKGGSDAGKGKQVYDATCAVCHGAGVAGAPKVGDKATWAPRLKAGLEALHASAIKGKGAMPPKGGNPGLSDADVAAAVDYMVNQSK